MILVAIAVFNNLKVTSRIYNDFPKEVATVQGITINRFDVNSWDGNSYASITIPGKGIVEMSYYGTGKFSLWRIGNYSLLFECNNNTRYATWLYRGSPYLKWFPEVNGFQELVEKYDEIIASIKKLPTNPDNDYLVYHDGKNIFHPFNKIGCDVVQNSISHTNEK